MGEKYVIDKATLDDIGDAIREKSGSTGSMTGSAMAGRIRAIELGVKLPSLSNPAIPGEVVSGKEYIDGDGVKQTGSHVCPSLGDLLPALSNPATAAKIFSGYQAINGAGQVMTGSAGSNITNAATAAKIALGFQALDKAGNLLTGTMVPYYLNSVSYEISRNEAGKAKTISLTTTGSDVVLAFAFREDNDEFNIYPHYWMQCGSLSGKTSGVSGYSGGTLSYSGNTVTLFLDKDDTVRYEVWRIYAFSK